MSELSIEQKYKLNQFPDAWKPDRNHAKSFAAANPTPTFAAAAPLLMDQPYKEVFVPHFFISACKEKYGEDWRFEPQHQYDGTCVGQSHKMVCDIGMGVNRYLNGTEFPGRSCVASNYAGGRVDIANMPGSWQGSNGSWSAEFLTKFGIVLLEDIGLPHDSKRPDELMALKWTRSRSGVPSDVEQIARQKPFENSQLVLTVEEVDAALAQFQTVNICTSLIPTPRRNKSGVSGMSRQGGHSTLIVGTRKVGRTKVYAYLQSWGNWARGPYGWKDHDPDGHFESSIVDITERDLREVLRSRDCYTFSGPQGLDHINEEYW